MNILFILPSEAPTQLEPLFTSATQKRSIAFGILQHLPGPHEPGDMILVPEFQVGDTLLRFEARTNGDVCTLCEFAIELLRSIPEGEWKGSKEDALSRSQAALERYKQAIFL